MINPKSFWFIPTITALLFIQTNYSFSQSITQNLTTGGEDEFSKIIGSTRTKSIQSFSPLFIVELGRPPSNTYDRVLFWSRAALKASAVGHTKFEDEPAIRYEQFGPHRASRATAMVHIAIFDALNSVARKYLSFTAIPDAASGTSADVAIAYAAHDVLASLYPQQAAIFRDLLLIEARAFQALDPAAVDNGIKLGREVARLLIEDRTNDDSSLRDPIVKGGTAFPGDEVIERFTEPGQWTPDPVSKIHTALGFHWGKVRPFAIGKVETYDVPPLPALTDQVYTSAYAELIKFGGKTSTDRTEEEKFKGTFWAYDGTANLCAPPNLYNQIALQVAEQQQQRRGQKMSDVDLARYLAVLNTAMADAAITAWYSKWNHKFWRPVTAIRAEKDDGNPATAPDPKWEPLGAPATNGRGPNFTPPFPAYPSGHAVFGGALFEVLRSYWSINGDETSEYFSFVSDEYNGENFPAEAVAGTVKRPRPKLPQSYLSFAAAEWENGRSRVWLGIHWQFDADNGIKQGNKVAKDVLASKFQLRP